MRILMIAAITILSTPCLAEGTFYFEMGGFYSNDRLWYYNEDGDRLSESGVTGHLAAGYEKSFVDETLILNIQLRHGSDSKKSGDQDITAHDEVGMVLRVNIY